MATTAAGNVAGPPRPDLQAYEASLRMTDHEIVADLREVLGPRLVAFIGSQTETRAVHEWADGIRAIRSRETVERLRLAYRIARMLSEFAGRTTAVSWMMGLNPYLDDRSPARLLREGDLEADGPEILGAARAFVAGL